MSETDIDSFSVGIIGGGRGGFELLKIFLGFRRCKVCFVVDLDSDAPGMQLASSKGIPVYSDFEKAFEAYRTDFIIEATGFPRVQKMILEKLPEGVEMIGSKSALFMFDMLEDIRTHVNMEVVGEISSVGREINAKLKDINRFIDRIKFTSVELDMLAINARIEAAHAGDNGKGFSMVADEVKNSARIVQKLANEISEINEGMMLVHDSIDLSLEKLK